MGKLLLVRHGQASYGAADYDQLSELGYTQSRRLAAYWVTHKFVPDHVFYGPLKRQKQTADTVAKAFRDLELPFARAHLLPDLEELRAWGTFRETIPNLLEWHPELMPLWNDGDPHQDDLGTLFYQFVPYWTRGELDVEGRESWYDFRARVKIAIDKIANSVEDGETAVAFTSAGTIATAMGILLNLEDDIALTMMWSIRNASVTEVGLRNGLAFLTTFNTTPHLPMDMITNV